MSLPTPFLFNRSDRTFVFIDGPNTYAATKALGIDIDYRQLDKELRAVTKLVRIHYYTPVATGEDYTSIRRLLDWLDYNGYTVVTEPLREAVSEEGQRRFKEDSLKIKLALEAQSLAIEGAMDHMVLFSGNRVFAPLIEAVKKKGVIVTVVSSLVPKPVLVADELRRATDHFMELGDMGFGFRSSA